MDKPMIDAPEYQPRTVERLIEMLRAKGENPRSWEAETADALERFKNQCEARAEWAYKLSIAENSIDQLVDCIARKNVKIDELSAKCRQYQSDWISSMHQVEQLNAELIASKPLYSRRQLQDENGRMVGILKKLLSWNEGIRDGQGNYHARDHIDLIREGLGAIK